MMDGGWDDLEKRSLRQSIAEIEALADKLAPGIKAAVLGFLTYLHDEVKVGAILKALKEGNPGKVLDMITGLDVSVAGAKVAEAVQTAVWSGAGLVAAGINLQLRGVVFSFNRLNPQLIAFLQGYSLRLIQQITDQSKEAVREALTAGMQRGASPITVARDVKQAIGLTPKQAKAVFNFRAQLETFHLRTGAAGWNLGKPIDRVNGRQVFRPDADGTPMDGIDTRRLRDFRFDSTLATAMKTGKPLSPEQIDKMVEAYRRKYLRHRSETIARTEAMRTTNQGVQEAWRQAIQSGKVAETLVRRQWIVSKDERTCETCGPVPKMNPPRGVKMDEPFKTLAGPVMLPPLHPNCRCTTFIRLWEPSQLAAIQGAP